PWRSAKCPGTSCQPSTPKKYGPPKSSASASAQSAACSQPSKAEARARRPTAIAVETASILVELRSAVPSGPAAIVNSAMWATRKKPIERAKASARLSNASGTQIAAINIEAIAAKKTSRTGPASGSITLVSQAYAAQAHQSTPSTSSPCASPDQVGWCDISEVHSVIARTKTRSKKS